MQRKPPCEIVLNPADRRLLVRRLLKWFAANARDLPWRRTLEPYAIWVSEIMLQQTQVKTVMPYYERWMKELPDAGQLARVSSARLHKLWEGLGYYTRARNLQKAAKVIMAEHAGQFPSERESILNLPGIGRYTAGAIASIAFNRPEPVVDGNVIRVLSRLFAIEGNPKERSNNEQYWQLAGELVGQAGKVKPPGNNRGLRFSGSCSMLNQSLMELGATICLPVHPKCKECPIQKQCAAFQRGETGRYPESEARAVATARRFASVVIEDNGRYLVVQRPEGVVNAQLWEFPNLEITSQRPRPLTQLARAFGLQSAKAKPFGTIRHSITRYRIRVDAWHVRMNGSMKLPRSRWVTAKQLDRLALTAAHRRLARMIIKERGTG